MDRLVNGKAIAQEHWQALKIDTEHMESKGIPDLPLRSLRADSYNRPNSVPQIRP